VVDTVKDLGPILKSLEEQLKNDSRTKDHIIKRMGLVNGDPNLAINGWIGLYADTVTYGPRTIGTGQRNWNFSPTFRIIVQRVDRADSARAHEKLEESVKAVLDVVLSDPTLTSYVEVLTGIQVTYAFSEEDRDSLHFEGALITLTFDGTTN
jgi:hypothetical protein